ncbi:NADPH-dependent FMN reductase [Pelobium manganitolerans]|uniref:NADPH-dependent FMN reductase n=1 Tax=Pelobium manganitolerans TaxID=1842495 RepID=A0A419SBV2_9SPHI|nr:NAD(P)H-dependent oxidoreductase [Pelobium manganitolerans]RKD20305.1 NADPH-dependent FMN reductase [Pelobium manganitolerans]
MAYQLKIIIGSTRQGRKGTAVADWFSTIAQEHSDFEVEVLDLKQIDLPLFDEEEHPRLKKYKHEHTKNWSKSIDAADAYVIVTPEYNFSYPATIKNALDYLSLEWAEKPLAFVSYGGLSGGMRAVQELKPVITTLGMMPIPQAVNIPMFTTMLNEQGIFTGNERLEQSANAMLNALLRWTKALKQMRENP